MATTKRDAICEAALELFAHQGVDGTSIREIAQGADTSEANIYRHFDGKDDLVRCIFEACAGQFHEVLARQVRSTTEPVERLRLLVGGIFVFAEEHPRAFTYLQSIHQGVLRRIDLQSEPLPMQLFTETLRAGIKAESFRSVPPVLATGWIVGLAQRTVTLMQSDLLSIPREVIVDQTCEAALQLVRAEN